MPRSNSSATRADYRLLLHDNARSPEAEAYKSLRTNIEFAKVDEAIRTVVITSAVKGEGKSTTAANLAVAYAKANKKVLLLDADLRAPSQHEIFRLDNRAGLSTLLSRQQSAEEATVPSGIPFLDVIPSGPVPAGPSEMLASRRMAALLEEWSDAYEMVIVDTPAVLDAADPSILSARCDGVLLVVDYGKVKKEAALKAKAALDLVQARFLGTVINNVRRMA